MTALVSFSKGQVITATPSTYDFAILDPHDAVGQLCDLVVVGDHHDGLVELRAGALEQAQHIGAGLAVQVAGRLYAVSTE